MLPAQDQPTQTKPLETVHSSITVTEKLSLEAPAAITSLTAQDLAENPGVNIDDRLRSVPGFSLFRRSSSLVANPTTQGVSLRGIGSSGASRTLVLWDGIPVNDPFGGWVYWTRFAPDDLERVEISRGASTSVFGDRAMGGAIALFSKPASPWRLHGGYEGGNRNTHLANAGLSNLWPHFAFSTAARALTTDGYYIVAPERRGRVDTMAGVRAVAGDTRLDWLGTRQRLFLKLDVLAEDRANGTVLQRNSTQLGQLSAQYNLEAGRGNLSLLGYHVREEFHASFSSVAANRLTESLTSIQSVPAESTGGAGIYRTRFDKANVLFGADFSRVEGYSSEQVFPAGSRFGGGTQLQRGIFAQADAGWKWLRFFAGGRGQSAGAGTNFFSPSGGVVAAHKQWRLHGNAFRSYRAPTLNELYRDFRQGNALTRANGALKPEFNFGSEVGIDYSGENFNAGVTFFRNDIDGIITTATLSFTPTLITRQRVNAGEALSRGVEANFAWRWRGFRPELAWIYTNTRLDNRFRVAQVPRHHGNAMLVWLHGRTFLSGGIRAISSQYEDAANQFLLPGFSTLQAAARYQLREPLALFASWENLLDRQYLTGFSPVPLVGAPRLWRAGLRFEGRIHK